MSSFLADTHHTQPLQQSDQRCWHQISCWSHRIYYCEPHFPTLLSHIHFHFFMQTLKELDLSCNQIEAAGAKDLATILKINTVEWLFISSISSKLHFLTQTVTTLNLSSNSIGSTGAEHVAYALRNNKVHFNFFCLSILFFMLLHSQSPHSTYQRIKLEIKGSSICLKV